MDGWNSAFIDLESVLVVRGFVTLGVCSFSTNILTRSSGVLVRLFLIIGISLIASDRDADIFRDFRC